MKKRQLKNLAFSKKTVSNLNTKEVKGGVSTYSLDLNFCTSGNVVSAILICYEGYTEQVCYC